jgi:polyisoprenoid-binding protein YceI
VDVDLRPGTFGIVAAESAARFILGERLGNSPNRVIGVSKVVSGTIEIDPADAAQAKLGPIRIDAGSFVTDDELRDSSVRAFILQADRYPEIVFTPTNITGLPSAAEVGDELAFDVTGDLTIRDITLPIVFDVTLEVQSADRLLGRAEAAILRSDFGLTIPEVPGVAEVDAEVQLRFTFVAERHP